MQLEPVYDEGESAALSGGTPSAIPGAVAISPEQQQLLGVRVEAARLESVPRQLRLLGRVVPDETRLFKINATIEGWVRSIAPAATTGTLVREDQILASYNAPEFLGPMQAYLYALSSMDRFAANKETESQLPLARANILQAKNSLVRLGMSELQISELTKTRQITEDIRLVSPAAGFIIVRNLFPGQRFEKGTEFFRIADLRSVWVMADLFESDLLTARPGDTAVVRYQGKAFRARMSNTLPQFDSASRTLKVRFELENPGFVLRPDMFVDVQLQLIAPPTLTVPADAVLDNGNRRVVFVTQGDGVFAPRVVETGWRQSDRIEIRSGLAAGEKIAVSGTFLIDSESRIKLTAHSGSARDPVCGMALSQDGPASLQSEFNGKSYVFCSVHCRRKFMEKPGRYAPEGQKRSVRGPA